jgi:hypothetical protein
LHSLLLLLFAVVGAAVAVGSTIVVSFAADCETIAACPDSAEDVCVTASVAERIFVD